jgi:uncharacterized membrane protein required for colicin V production
MVNLVDLAIVVIVAVGAAASLRTGFLREAFALFGLVAGVYVGLSYCSVLARFIHPLVHNAGLAAVVAFLLLLIMVWICFLLLGGALGKTLKSLGIDWLNHLAGLIVGMLAGLFWAIVLTLVFVRHPELLPEGILEQSRIVPLILQKILPYLRQVLPKNLRILVEI